MAENQCHLPAVCRTIRKRNGWYLSPVPPGQARVSPKTLTALKGIGALGGSVRGEDVIQISIELVN